MTSTIKSSLFIIFIICLLSACNTKLSKDVRGSFGILGTDLENKTIFLIDEIDMKISTDIKTPVEISKDKTIEVLESVYDSLSTLNHYHLEDGRFGITTRSRLSL